VADRVTFTPSAADRIAAAVRGFEAGERDGEPLKFSKPLTEQGRSGTILIGTHSTAAWAKFSQKTVTIMVGTPGTNGLPTSSAYMLTVNNIFAALPVATASTARWVAVGFNGFAHYLVSAEC
jgi:hypothetical protein